MKRGDVILIYHNLKLQNLYDYTEQTINMYSSSVCSEIYSEFYIKSGAFKYFTFDLENLANSIKILLFLLLIWTGEERF